MSTRLTVVVPTHDTRELTLRCLASLAAEGRAIATIVVDDGGSDGTAEAIAARCPQVRVLRLSPGRGFTAAANHGLMAAESELMLLLNSDAEVAPGALARMIGAFDARPCLGAAGAALHFPDGRPQWSGGREPTLGWLLTLASGAAPVAARLPGYRRVHPLHRDSATTVDWVTGAALAMRRTVWDAVGALDERFRLYAQDLDWCVRVRDAGYEVAILPDVRVTHVGGATIGRLPGAVGAAHPERLWEDLVRWVAKRHGAAAARRAIGALRFGGALRLAARALAGQMLPPHARRLWEEESAGYRRARAALATFSAMATS